MSGKPTTSSTPDPPVELSVVMPCLNEVETVAHCVRKAWAAIERAGVCGEVVVADNGSTDGSIDAAQAAGARVVPAPKRGYGAALNAGIGAARGRYIVMADADDSYDFGEVMRFLEPLRAGADLVHGCRLPRGGGTILPGAMPFLHRYVGNPFLTWCARRMFRVKTHDIYCGMRGFTRELFDGLDLRCTGMEFATEMTIKAALFRHRIVEVPITLHPDGRTHRKPHLRTFRDGWRTLRFFLLCSPKWLFLQPGKVLLWLGAVFFVLGLFGVEVPLGSGVVFGTHTMLVGALLLLLGHQCVTLAVYAKTFAVQNRLVGPHRRLERFNHWLTLEKVLPVALVLVLIGVGCVLVPTVVWVRGGMGPLDYPATMPWVIGGALSILLGVQTALASFMIGVLGLPRR